MKKLFFSLFAISLMAGTAAQAQKVNVPYDSVKKVIVYSEVVQVPGADKAKLYDRATATLNEIFKEAAKKMTVNDKEAGKIELNCTSRVVLKDPKSGVMAPQEFIKYKLSIAIKDGKYKYDAYDFHMDRGGKKYPMEKYVEKDYTVIKSDRPDEKLEFVNNDVRSVIAKLKAGMSSDKVEKKEDW